MALTRLFNQVTVQLEESLGVEVGWVQAVDLLPHLLQLVPASLSRSGAESNLLTQHSAELTQQV